MTYTRKDFGKELMAELEKGYDIVHLSRWAMSIYMKHYQETDQELDKVIMSVVAIEEGPEFEFSEQELRQMAKDLQEKETGTSEKETGTS